MSVTADTRRTSRSSRLRALGPLIVLSGTIAFLAGTWIVSQPARHPRSGRIIAGISSSAMWLERPSRGAEEAPDLALAALDLRP